MLDLAPQEKTYMDCLYLLTGLSKDQESDEGIEESVIQGGAKRPGIV